MTEHTSWHFYVESMNDLLKSLEFYISIHIGGND